MAFPDKYSFAVACHLLRADQYNIHMHTHAFTQSVMLSRHGRATRNARMQRWRWSCTRPGLAIGDVKWQLSTACGWMPAEVGDSCATCMGGNRWRLGIMWDAYWQQFGIVTDARWQPLAALGQNL
eukprot:366092-Chlamydomonas_euryale.AAC.8